VDSFDPTGLVGPMTWPLAMRTRRFRLCSCGRQVALSVPAVRMASGPQEDLHDHMRPDIAGILNHPTIGRAYGSCNSNEAVLRDTPRTHRGCFASSRSSGIARRRNSCGATPATVRAGRYSYPGARGKASRSGPPARASETLVEVHLRCTVPGSERVHGCQTIPAAAGEQGLRS
jgi:hypothetical protein